jgi:hypothetical protein
VLERLLYRLSQTKHRDRFVLKEQALREARAELAHITRVTTLG